MEENVGKRWRSKVAVGLRVKVPKELAGIYGLKKDDIVEWIYDEKGSIRIEIKEMVLREKKAKVETVNEGMAVNSAMRADDKKVKVRMINDRDAFGR